MDLKEFRGAYPQYDDMPDQELVDGLHAKHYSDIPKDDFYKSIGYSPAPTERSTTQKYITDPLARGHNRLEQAANVGAALAGLATPEEAATNLAANEKDIASYPVPEDIAAGSKEIMDSASLWEATKAAIRNPKAISNVFVESIANSIPSVAAGLGGAVAGGVAGSAVPVVGTFAGASAGAATGVGLGSGITEYLGSISEQMAESKVDMNDESAIAKALTDPAFMEGAKEKALKRGIAIGVFDALSAGFAGRIAGPIGKAVGAARLPSKKIVGEGAEVAAQAGAGGAGEYVAQQLTGEDKPGAVVLEMAAEVPSGAAEIAGGRILKNMGAKKDAPPPPPPTTMPNARAALGQPPAPGTVASPASPPGNGAAPGVSTAPGAGSQSTPPPKPTAAAKPAAGERVQFRDPATGESGEGTVLAVDDVELDDGTIIPNVTIDLGNGRVKDAPLEDLEIGAAGAEVVPTSVQVPTPGQVEPVPDMTGEPALPAGHVRLYRGVGNNVGEAGGTAFLTTNKKKAGQYGDVHYVDVPATRESLVRFIQGHGGPDEFVTDSQDVLGALRPLTPTQAKPAAEPPVLPEPVAPDVSRETPVPPVAPEPTAPDAEGAAPVIDAPEPSAQADPTPARAMSNARVKQMLPASNRVAERVAATAEARADIDLGPDGTATLARQMANISDHVNTGNAARDRAELERAFRSGYEAGLHGDDYNSPTNVGMEGLKAGRADRQKIESQEGVVLQPDGRGPWKTEKGAAFGARQAGGGLIPVKLDAGWGLTKPPQPAEVGKKLPAQRRAEKAAKPTPAAPTHTPIKHRPGYGNAGLRAKILERAQKALERKGIKTQLTSDALELINPVTADADMLVADEVQRQTDISIERARIARERGAPQSSAMKRYGILGWIAKRGGMIDADGIMKAMDLDAWHKGKPGMRKAVREAGVQQNGNLLGRVDSQGRDYSPDGTLTAAIEDGILEPDATLDDLYEEIRKSAAMEKPRVDPDFDEQEQRARERIADFVAEKRKRVRFTDDMANDALERVRNGATIEDAVDGVIEDDAIYGERDLALDAKQDEVGDGWDIPFEIDAGPAQEAGGAASPEGGKAAEIDGAAKASGEAEGGGAGGDSKQASDQQVDIDRKARLRDADPNAKRPSKPLFGWNAVKLYENYTLEELNQLRRWVESQPENHNNNPDDINLYTKEARRKTDAIAWAVTYHLRDKKNAGAVTPAIDKVSTVDGVKDQIVIPGAEAKSAAEAKEAEKARVKAIEDEKEALRQSQSKLRRGNQKSIKDQDDGLFSAKRDQDDMFAAPKVPAKPTVPADQVALLRILGWDETSIEEATPAERAQAIADGEEAAKSVQVVLGHSNEPGSYFIASGEKNAMYTLMKVERSNRWVDGGIDGAYVANLAAKQGEAIDKAKFIVAANGGTTLYSNPPQLNARESIGGSGGAGNAVIDRSGAEIAPDSIPRAPAELTDQEAIAQHGLVVSKETAKSGKVYWAVTGNLADNKAVLDALKFGDPFKMGGRQYRSIRTGDPTAALAAALRGAPLEPVAEITPPEPAMEPGEAVRVLMGAKLKIERDGDKWVVSGKGTFDAKDAIKSAGGKWDGASKKWRFDRDPTEAIAAALNQQKAGDGGNAEGDAGAGVDADEDARLRELRQREDQRPDERNNARDVGRFVGADTQALIRNGIKFGIPEAVVADQIEDVAMINSAYQSGKPAFILANEAGTGKTFVLGGAIREMRKAGAKNFVYVTMNQDLIAQIKRDLAPYGVDDVKFHTYSELSGRGGISTKDAVLIFDEAHNIKNVGGGTARAEAGQGNMAEAKFTIIASATPFENPVESRYLQATGIFDKVGGFNEWAKAYGAAVKRRKFYNPRTGQQQVEEIIYWVGGKSKKKDAAAARQWFFNQAVMSQRPMRIDPSMVDVQFRRAKVPEQWVDMYDRVSSAYEEAEREFRDEDGNSRDYKITSEIARHRENTIKRILEASKVQFAIDRARDRLADGKNVVIFVETKADRELGRFRKSEHFKDPTLYTFPEMQSLMAEWQSAADMARAMEERAPPKPFADFIYEIARAFHAMGISYELPSTADEITKALGADNVAIYTGAVSNSAAAKNKADFLAGKKSVLVATMAKGGTGLSLHDTRGDRPTVQININLPWKATGVDQVSGRVARYGLQSKAEIEWLFASNIAWESTKLAPRVGARMRDMGAVVKGLEIKAAEALDGDFDFEGAIDIKQVAGEGAIDVAAGEDGSLGSGDIYDAADRLERTRVKAENTSGGFFATPFPVAAFMQRISGVRPGETVLEPSAGHGNLIRFMPEGAKITAVEQRPDNFEALGKIMGDRAELHNADFMAWADENAGKQFDVIVMNPPFERLKGVGPQDALHVRTAYDMLAPGGRLVAIMGEGVFFRQFKEETAFREWLDDAGATVIKLPEDTFKRSGTGARARMIVIDKDRPGGRSDISLDDVSAKALRDEEGVVPRRVSDRASFSRESTPTDTPAFRKWFGDSKVVDDDGKPLVVYHGTGSTGIEEFMPAGGGTEGRRALDMFRKAMLANDRFGYMNFRSGTFFSPDPAYAGNYVGETSGTMYPVYIKAENPIYFDMKTRVASGIDPKRTPDALILTEDGKINEVAIIDPTQIKSVFNRGTFDPADPRILFDRDTTPSAPPAYMKAEKIKDATIYTDERTADERANMARRLNAMISRIAGGGVRLRVVDRIEADAGGMGFGLFPRDNKGTIYVTLRDFAGMTETATHELIHLMRAANMIDMKAWAVLSARAPEWRVRFKTEEKYAPDVAAWRADGMPETEVQQRLDEEAIADAAKEYGAGRLDATGALARALEMINRFLELIRNILDGYGATTAKGVLADIHAGRFADGRRVGGMGGVRPGSAMQAAWHGTPHKVDRFSLDKIGTGEGNQAYGWGLYFAGRRKVGEHYRKKLAGEKIVTIGGQDFSGEWYDPVLMTEAKAKLYSLVKDSLRGTPVDITRSAIDHVLGREYYGESMSIEGSAQSLARRSGTGTVSEREGHYVAALREIARQGVVSRAAGNLYKVDIAPTDDQLLDWDASVSSQPETALAALENLTDHPGLKDEREISWGGGPIDWTQFDSGKDIYRWLSDNLGSDQAASLALRDAGIPGIRYLDGTSRKAREGNHNYVIFDDSLITITGSFDRPSDEAAALAVANRDIRTIIDTVFRAPKPADSVEVIEEKTADDISWFKRMLYTPEAIFRNLAKSDNGLDPNDKSAWAEGKRKTAKVGRALYGLWQKSVKLETDQSEYLHRLRREVSSVRDAVSEENWNRAWDVLWTGDAEGVEYTPAETAEMVAAGELTPDAAKTYHAMRKVFDRMGRFVDQHERKMKPTIRKRKFQLLRMMARDLGIQETEFRGRMAYIGSLRAQLRDGTADPEAMAAKIEQESERLFGAKIEDPRFMEMDAELKAIDARLSSTTVRRREGYVPHKFFGTWAVYAKEMNAEGEEVLRLLASEKEGFYPDRDAAVRGANAHVGANPGAQVVVRPVQFKFPNSQATEMSDAAYFRFMGNVERELELSGQELQDMVQGVARKRYRRRSASFKNFRQGIEGYSRQIDAVMNAHIGETVRYVVMDELKYEAINTFERNGLSRNRSTITDNPTLAGMVEQWFKDINGQKQSTEAQLDDLLSKPWARPINVAMASGAVAFLAGGGITMSPAIGLALGGYVGYRMYKGMAGGGNFKTRAVTGSMLSDMAHLKLGAFTNVMSAVVNLSQTAMNTWPVLGSKWTAVGIKRYTKAMHDQMLGRPNPDIALLRRGNVNTVFKQSEVSPHLFEGESGLARASMFLFNQAESLNRGVAFLGAYARAEANAGTPGAALRAGKAILLRTQFHYGAANKPEVLRNVLLRVPLQFKNFLAQQLTFMFGLNRREAGKFLLATFLLAGALGMPGAELLDMLTDAIAGFSPIVEIKRLMASAMAEGGAIGGMATMLSHGLPALFGIDTSSRTGMGDIFPTQGRDLIGPWFSTMIGAAKMGAENASFVDQLRGLSPGLGAPLKSVEAAANGLPITMWPSEAAKAVAGEPSVFTDDEALLTSPLKRNRLEYRPTTGELASKAIGAMPIRESQLRDLNQVLVHDDRKKDRIRARAIDQIVASIKVGDYDAIAEIRTKAAERDVNITSSMIKDALKQANTPRLERLIKMMPKADRPEAMESYRAILSQNEGGDDGMVN